MNRQFLLNERPLGRDLETTDFKLVESDIPSPGDDEVLVKVMYLGVDPAMKGWMENRADYVAPLEIGDLMRGNGIGRVIESNNDRYPEGMVVSGGFGWQEYAVSDSKSIPLNPVPEGVPPTAALSLLGITGLTAYFGFLEVGQPKEGDVVLISGAAGATGSVVGQLAKLKGCSKVVGIAGSQEKCDWLVNELGFDAAINYREEDQARRVRELCPDGIDVFFDNVGGKILDEVLAADGGGSGYSASSCRGWTPPGGASPSTVITSRSWASSTGRMQDSVGLPSRSTVHAPQSPLSHPCFDPVSPRT